MLDQNRPKQMYFHGHRYFPRDKSYNTSVYSDNYQTVPYSDYTQQLLISSFTMNQPYMLLEGESCMYGGLYIIDDSYKKLRILCSPLKEKIYIHVQGKNILLLFILYGGYSTTDVKMSMFCVSTKAQLTLVPTDTANHTNGSSEIILQTNTIKDYIFRTSLNHSYNKYSFLFDQPRTIEFTFQPLLTSSRCIRCTVHYAQFTRFVHKKHLSQNYFEEEILSPVKSIEVNSKECSTQQDDKWFIRIKIVDLFKDKFSEISRDFVSRTPVAVNITYMINMLSVTSGKLHLLLPAFDGDWGWHILHFEFPDGVIWKFEQELPLTIREMYLEVLEKVYSNDWSSLIYTWNNISDHSTTWITGCKKCNLIYFTSCRNESESLTITIRKHVMLRSSLLNKTYKEKKITFYKFR